MLDGEFPGSVAGVSALHAETATVEVFGAPPSGWATARRAQQWWRRAIVAARPRPWAARGAPAQVRMCKAGSKTPRVRGSRPWRGVPEACGEAGGERSCCPRVISVCRSGDG